MQDLIPPAASQNAGLGLSYTDIVECINIRDCFCSLSLIRGVIDSLRHTFFLEIINEQSFFGNNLILANLSKSAGLAGIIFYRFI